MKKVLSELLQNSQENTCARASFLIKKRLWYMCFPVNFAKFLRTPFHIEHLWWLLLFIDAVYYTVYYAVYYTVYYTILFIAPFHCAILNFEKKIPLLTKEFFSRSFHSCKIFHKTVSCVKNRTKRQFDQIKYISRIWLNRREKSSIPDVWLGSKYACVRTLHLKVH